MTHCAKCGAELIGLRRFCSACGAPAVDPRGTGSSPGSAPGAPGAAYGGAPAAPSSKVNPFATTAMPAQETRDARPSEYGPPPAAGAHAMTSQGLGDPSIAPQVSPLAVSNVAEERNAFQHAMASAPGTQLMPSVPHPPSPSPGPVRPEPPKGVTQDKTQLLAAFPQAPAQPPPQAQPPQAQPPQAQPPQAQPPQAPAHGAQGGWQGGWGAPAQPQQPPVQPQQPPVQPQQALPPQQPQPPPQQHVPQPLPHAYGYPPQGPAGYAPGARVSVTWANGQRYPGTVHQMSGTQCLVVFPDGQQHWVDVQYVAPA